MDTGLNYSDEARNLKKFARYNLVAPTNHARERCDERGICVSDVLRHLKVNCKVLTHRFVDNGVILTVQISGGVEVVIAKQIDVDTQGVRYGIVTAYKI